MKILHKSSESHCLSHNPPSHFPMARHLLLMHTLPSTSQLVLAVITLLLCAIALLMCASHSRKWHRRWTASACFRFANEDPVIRLNNEATILTTNGVHGIQSGNGGESMFSGELSVWKKNIIMGGKCQLPDFSGVIIYDSSGNVVTPARTPRPLLTWK